MSLESQTDAAATEGCAPAAGYADCPYADGRPQWCELCDCVTVNRTVRPRGMNESLENFAARSETILRAAYNLGADWSYDADCPHCDTGRKHIPDEIPQGRGGRG